MSRYEDDVTDEEMDWYEDDNSCICKNLDCDGIGCHCECHKQRG